MEFTTVEVPDFDPNTNDKGSVVRHLAALTSAMKAVSGNEAATQRAIDKNVQAIRGLTSKWGQLNANVPSHDGGDLDAATSARMYRAFSDEDLQDGMRANPNAWLGPFQMIACKRDGERTYGLLDDPNPSSDWQRKLQLLITQRSMVRLSRKSGRSHIMSRKVYAHLLAGPPEFRALIETDDFRQRIFGNVPGSGQEWIQLPLLPELSRFATMPRMVLQLFQQRDMPAQGYQRVLLNSGLRPFRANYMTSDLVSQLRKSTIGTGNTTIQPDRLAVCTFMDSWADEHYVLQEMPVIQAEVQDAFADGLESLVINAQKTLLDTDLPNYDPGGRWGVGDYGTADHRRGTDKGLRRTARDGTNAVVDLSGNLNADGLRKMAQQLQRPSMAMRDLPVIMGPEQMLRVLGWDELQLYDAAGAGATITAGLPLRIYNQFIPVVSEFVGGTLNDDGIYDGVTADKTEMLMTDPRYRTLYIGREILVEQDKDITTQTRALVGTWAGQFEEAGNPVGNTTVSGVKIPTAI